MGLANEPEEDEEEENAAGNRKQPERNPVGGNQGWENENTPTSAPSMLGIHRGAAGRFTKQATTLPEEGNTPNAGTKARALHRLLMGGNHILQNTIGGRKRNGRRDRNNGSTNSRAAARCGKGKYRMVSADGGRENVWAISNYTGFLEKLLKWQADVGGESTNCATFKIQALEAENLRVFVGMVKGDAELKIFHSIKKYIFFCCSKSLWKCDCFHGGPSIGRKAVYIKIPRDKPWAWHEIKFLSNPIEMQTHFSQEENRHTMWDTTVVPRGM